MAATSHQRSHNQLATGTRPGGLRTPPLAASALPTQGFSVASNVARAKVAVVTKVAPRSHATLRLQRSAGKRRRTAAAAVPAWLAPR